jgi:hypothetical protein
VLLTTVPTGHRHIKKSTKTASAFPPLGPLRCLFRGRGRGVSRRPDLVRHPLTEIAVFGIVLTFLQKRDAGSAVRNAVAVANSQVREIIAKDMGTIAASGFRLSMCVNSPSPYRREGVNHTTRPTVGRIFAIEKHPF